MILLIFIIKLISLTEFERMIEAQIVGGSDRTQQGVFYEQISFRAKRASQICPSNFKKRIIYGSIKIVIILLQL